jgi:hypothetical protein
VDGIDVHAAARFLAALGGDAQFTFQTFGEAHPGRRTLTRVLHGTPERYAVTLQSLNLKGAGVFVMVNRGDLQGRKESNVTGVRAVFLDLDGAPLTPVLESSLPPRIVVESSPGKWHCYWPVVDMPLERFNEAQKALANRFQGDPKVCDLPRVMRLPGFLHHKGAPFQSRLVTCERGTLTWRELVAAFDLPDRMCLPGTILTGSRNSSLYALARSAAHRGVPEDEQLAKAHQVNAERCSPQLDAAEVNQLVASAYSRPVHGVASIPFSVLDGEAYKSLDDAARTLLLLASRRAHSFGDFTLPHSELKAWFPRKDTFHAIRKRAVASGLLVVTQPAAKAMPRKGRGPRPGFYRLAIGSFGVAYSRHSIGALDVAPEALQAPSSEALPDATPVEDPHGIERCAA